MSEPDPKRDASERLSGRQTGALCLGALGRIQRQDEQQLPQDPREARGLRQSFRVRDDKAGEVIPSLVKFLGGRHPPCHAGDQNSHLAL